MTARRSVAYRITGGDSPTINYFGVVSPDIVLSPALAVEALRLHGFEEAFVQITQDAAATVRHLWTMPIATDYEKDLCL